MEIAEFLRVYLYSLAIVEFQQILQSAEVDIVGGIEGLGCTEDTVRNGNTPTEEGRIFDVIDSVKKMNQSRIIPQTFVTYRSEAV